jgi:hypothetical protein
VGFYVPASTHSIMHEGPNSAFSSTVSGELRFISCKRYVFVNTPPHNYHDLRSLSFMAFMSHELGICVGECDSIHCTDLASEIHLPQACCCSFRVL